MSISEDIIEYWLNTVGPKGWYAGSDELDQDIRTRFQSVWEDALEGGLGTWLIDARGTLAYLILTDQFPRNMFRGDPRSFSTDAMARAAAKDAIALEWDQQVGIPERQFFFMPLMHSESLVDQDRAVEVFQTRMGDDDGNAIHAQVHREIIRDFGRFPYRNDALGRVSSEAETAFISGGGYAKILKELQSASAGEE